MKFSYTVAFLSCRMIASVIEMRCIIVLKSLATMTSPNYGVAAQGKNVDELGVFFGLHAPDAQTVSTTAGPKSEWSVESEVRLYVDTSADVVILTCEVSLPSKQHSLHLLCPLIPETRLCFENCKRVCSLPDCSDSPELFSVDCVEDAFVRDMYNIWKFRYIINRYNVAIDGAWSCFHAGKETHTVNVTSVQTTSAAPSTAHLPLNLPHIWSFKQSSDGRIEDGVEAATHESMDLTGKLDIEEDFFSNTSSFTSREAWNSNGTLLSHLMQGSGSALRTVILVLVAFLVISILINVLSVLVLLLKRSAARDGDARNKSPLNLSSRLHLDATQSRHPTVSAPYGRSNGFTNAATDPVGAKPDQLETSFSRENQHQQDFCRANSALERCLPCYRPVAAPVEEANASAFRQPSTPQVQTAVNGSEQPVTTSATYRQHYTQPVELGHLHPVVSNETRRLMPPTANAGAAFAQTVPLRRRRRTSDLVVRTTAFEHGCIPLRLLGPVSAFTNHHEPAAMLARKHIPRLGGFGVRSRVLQPTSRVVQPPSSGQASCHSTFLHTPLTQSRLPESNPQNQHIFVNHSQQADLAAREVAPLQAPVLARQLNDLVVKSAHAPLATSAFSRPEWRDVDQLQMRQQPPPGAVLLQVSDQGHCNGVVEPVTSSSYLVLQNVSTSTYVPVVTTTDRTRQYTDGTPCIAVNSAVLSGKTGWPWPRGSQCLVKCPTQSHSSLSSADRGASDSDLASFV